MNKSVLTEIEQNNQRFSKGQIKIANYVLEHYDKAAFMTAAKLGVTVGTSESTVVRFASKLGYIGYPQLQKALQEMVRSKLTSVQRMEVTADNMTDDIISEVLTGDMETIRETMELVSTESFNASVNAVNSARKIYILGVRSSSALASFAYFYFNLVYDNVILIDTSGESEMFEQVFRITNKDVCLAISFPRYSKKTVNILRFISDRGASIISLTDSELSPIAQYADHLLIARSNIASIVDSLTAPLSLLNAFIVAATQSRHDSICGTLNSLEEIWDKYNVYENSEE